MADLTLIQLLYTSDPTVSPAVNEKYGELKADENGVLWMRDISEIGGGIGIRTARTPDKDDVDPNDSDNDAQGKPIVAFDSISFTHVFNDTTGKWDRLRADGDDADGIAPQANGLIKTVARLTGFNGATWDRILALGNDFDNMIEVASGFLATLNFNMIWNGADWSRDYKSAPFNAVVNVTALSASSSIILTGDKNRKYILIQNTDDTNDMVINFGTAATETNGVIIKAKNSYEPLIVPTTDIQAIAKTADIEVRIITA